MKYAVRYFTRSGNTKKLCDEIAKKLNIESLDVTHPLNDSVDILFLGSSVYAAGIDDSIKQFIRTNKEHISSICNISTAAVAKSTYRQVKKIADECGITLLQKDFSCRGSFGPIHKNHPDHDDLKALSKNFCIITLIFHCSFNIFH